MGRIWNVAEYIEERWQVLDVLAGGMGSVYIVRDRQTSALLAAKTFKHPQLAARFQQEAELWIKLGSHPNVTRALFFHYVDRQPLLFLEHVSGGNLYEWIKRQRQHPNLRLVLRFALQFCDAMQYAYVRGIQVHRDIKPHNCLLTAEGNLKVTDFGIAKAYEEISAGDATGIAVPDGTLTGCHLGTARYMAPEQFDDAKHVTRAADVYSFGIMLFELLTGQAPFQSGYYEAHHHHQVPPTNVDPELDSLIFNCTQKQAGLRFQDFASIRQRLEPIHARLLGRAAQPFPHGSRLTAQEYVDRGSSLIELKDFDGAIAALDRALRLDPDFANAWYHKGRALLAKRERAEALACAERADILDPENSAILCLKARALWDLYRWPEAQQCVESSLAAAETYEALVLKGEMGGQAGQDALRRATQLFPHRGRAYRILGEHEYWNGHYDQALPWLQKAVERNSQSAAKLLSECERAIDRRRWLRRGVVARATWPDGQETVGVVIRPAHAPFSCDYPKVAAGYLEAHSCFVKPGKVWLIRNLEGFRFAHESEFELVSMEVPAELAAVVPREITVQFLNGDFVFAQSPNPVPGAPLATEDYLIPLLRAVCAGPEHGSLASEIYKKAQQAMQPQLSAADRQKNASGVPRWRRRTHAAWRILLYLGLMELCMDDRFWRASSTGRKWVLEHPNVSGAHA